ncbi:MAG TPA: adenosine deaminase [Ktedonobacteraceae bacterium]|nr:adenosine deaminase [Ktedonobacteraceae bacterium]
MSLESYAQAAPKAELHVHLEGAIQPATALAIARRNNISLPVENEAELRQRFAYRDFDHFIETFSLVTGCLRTSEDYEQIVYEFGAEMARQNVHYAEVTVTPATHHLLGVPHDVYFSGMQRGRARARADFNVQINWIFNIVRRWLDVTRTRPMADYVTSVAIEGKDYGVVALGLAGSEAGAPPEPFAPWFERACAAGLHSAPHAGEMAGPDSIRGAITALGAERIAHGVRATEDPALVDYLAQHHIPLDITPTSNIYFGVYPDYAVHPLPRLYAKGATITVSTDDPPLFNTTMNQEVSLLATQFGLNIAAIDEILLNGIRYSFLPEQRRKDLETEFKSEMAMLRRKRAR